MYSEPSSRVFGLLEGKDQVSEFKFRRYTSKIA